MGVTQADLTQALHTYFAPWVLSLGLTPVSQTEQSVTLSLPVTAAVARAGGVLCGQAMMAAADTAMALALMQHFGEFRPCTTVSQNSTFLKPLSGQDLLITAKVLRAGKTMAFGQIDLCGANDAKLVCQCTATFALL
ncbi:MAG: hypothetical protein RLZZ502_239 [Pseudomonadota bacterium]|jgi:uncharacterized protein (TIGR00369 family)